MLLCLFFCSIGLVLGQPLISEESIEPDYYEETTETTESPAGYNFGYSIQDGISGANVERTELRENKKVTGAYSYSDGFIRQTVLYEADENGFRVTDIQTEPIGDGPVYNEDGEALVQTFVDGIETSYAIKAQPLKEEPVQDFENGNFEEYELQ